MINIVCVIMVVCAIFGLIGLIIKIGNDGKKELLDKMFNNNDISATIYKKYKNN
jgi:hypothetical protein